MNEGKESIFEKIAKMEREVKEGLSSVEDGKSSVDTQLETQQGKHNFESVDDKTGSKTRLLLSPPSMLSGCINSEAIIYRVHYITFF